MGHHTTNLQTMRDKMIEERRRAAANFEIVAVLQSQEQDRSHRTCDRARGQSGDLTDDFDEPPGEAGILRWRKPAPHRA